MVTMGYAGLYVQAVKKRPSKKTVDEALEAGEGEDISYWLPECLEAELRFKRPAAKLYPLLNQMVETSKGKGKLWQVFDNRVGIILEGEDKVTFVKPGAVKPIAGKIEPSG